MFYDRTSSPSGNNCKLTEAEVIEIRRVYALGKYSCRQIADAVGVETTAVNRIVNRRTWKHI